ncbi:hypothetical protein KI387_009348, partial [Taxus chinensis]
MQEVSNSSLSSSFQLSIFLDEFDLANFVFENEEGIQESAANSGNIIREVEPFADSENKETNFLSELEEYLDLEGLIEIPIFGTPKVSSYPLELEDLNHLQYSLNEEREEHMGK